MPSARRRRFSVHNKISNQETNKSQNETQISKQDEIDLLQNMNSLKYKTKINPSTSKKLSLLEIVTECKSGNSVTRVHENNTITSDKEVTASSSNINLYTVLNSPNVLSVTESTEINNETKQREHYQRDKTPHHDKHLHRVKVRSPRRKVSYMNKEVKKKSIGIGVQLNNYNEKEHRNENEIIKQVIDVGENTEYEEEEISSHSLEDMCRICHSGDAVSDAGNLISACLCRGTIGRVHVKCLERWLTESGKSRCELCGTKYVTRRVHRFGILKAFIMWILSHNSKNMIVDFFGIMIMTPIAVVGAGLTERTFTGLMAQDHQTPWPLASTFVLACMTLVCYYCWIVSALTRHALGWWIWYRSHYEVRLELQEDEQ